MQTAITKYYRFKAVIIRLDMTPGGLPGTHYRDNGSVRPCIERFIWFDSMILPSKGVGRYREKGAIMIDVKNNGSNKRC